MSTPMHGSRPGDTTGSNPSSTTSTEDAMSDYHPRHALDASRDETPGTTAEATVSATPGDGVPEPAAEVGSLETLASEASSVSPVPAPLTEGGGAPAATTTPKSGGPSSGDQDAGDGQQPAGPPPGMGARRGPGGMARGGEKAMNFGPSLRRLAGYLRPDRTIMLVAVLMAALGVACSVVGPRILGHATNTILRGFLGRRLAQQFPAGTTTEQAQQMLRQAGHGDQAAQLQRFGVQLGHGIDFHHLGMILWGVLGLYLASALLSFLQGWILSTVVQRGVFRMREAVSHKLNRLPLGYFDSQQRGDLLSRVTNDIDNVAQTLQQTMSQVLNAVLTLVGVLIMMFTVSWELALISLVVVPVSGVAAALIGKRAQSRFAAQWKATGAVNAQVEEAYTGHSLVKVFGRQREVEEAFRRENEQMFRASFSAQVISGLIMPVMFLIGNLNYVLIAVIGGLKVAHGSMTVGDVQAFMQYSRQFTQPVTQVASMANLLQSGVASAERVFQVLDAEEQSPEATGSLPQPVEGRVVFDHVQFSYVPDQPLITDLSLVAEPGQTIAIVGPTGAGKTTLVNLLMRFYELDGGRITLDGVDISSVPRAQLRDQMGMVLQDTWLFNGTIRDNIAYGRPGATEDDIIAAAKAAYVDRFVHTLPDGYDTIIDEEGSNVSAGEKQLITIARAFLSEPGLLILDEATSSVDTRTELLVQRAMTNLRAHRTSFVIAHRLSTIRDADLILVMEHGDIVEQGTHAELLERHGHYHDLYQSQFNAASDAA